MKVHVVKYVVINCAHPLVDLFLNHAKLRINKLILENEIEKLKDRD